MKPKMGILAFGQTLSNKKLKCKKVKKILDTKNLITKKVLNTKMRE